MSRPGASASGPSQVIIDSREATEGSLFIGLPGARVDGGEFAAQALQRGAWGVLVEGSRADGLGGAEAAVLTTADPLRSLQSLATAWRRHLNAQVIGVTGSTGKTSTKDILSALIAPHRRAIASRANFNTEIGMPLEICNAPEGTEVMVLEMAMRGAGQIAELAEIAEPDVAVIVSIGPVHLELLGSLENIAAAKAEIVAGLKPGGTAIIPAGETLLDPHRREDITTVTFGPGGDVRLTASEPGFVEIDHLGERIVLEVPFPQAHMRNNLLAAVAAARAIGISPSGRVELKLSSGRGQHEALGRGVTLIDDSYNANPMSMRASLAELAVTPTQGRRIAVLGDMLELGPTELSFHEEMGSHAEDSSVDVLVTVGPLAAAMARTFRGEVHLREDAAGAGKLAAELVQPGDTVLVKASRGIGLELVCQTLRQALAPPNPIA